MHGRKCFLDASLDEPIPVCTGSGQEGCVGVYHGYTHASRSRKGLFMEFVMMMIALLSGFVGQFSEVTGNAMGASHTALLPAPDYNYKKNNSNYLEFIPIHSGFSIPLNYANSICAGALSR